jgi:hypothetical protein
MGDYSKAMERVGRGGNTNTNMNMNRDNDHHDHHIIQNNNHDETGIE